jgi:hypothetical protein
VDNEIKDFLYSGCGRVGTSTENQGLPVHGREKISAQKRKERNKLIRRPICGGGDSCDSAGQP